MKIFIRGAAAALALSLVGVTGAEAQFLTPADPDCDFMLSLSGDFEPDAIDCSGAWEGNNKNQEDDVLKQINEDWGIADSEVIGSVDLDGTSTSGSLTVPFDIYGGFILALKAGDTFSLYLFDLASGTLTPTIEYTTQGAGTNDQGAAQGLSHYTVYTGRNTTVPEPSTMLLLATGLIALGFVARRRQEGVLTA